jgi:lipopolysaccharide transport system permease protein
LDFGFAFLIFIGLMIYYRFLPSLTGVLMIVPCLFATLVSALGLGFFFSAVNIKYRDVRYALPFFIQLLIFVTPVIYSTAVLGKYQWLWYFNPMSGVINLMRATLLQVGEANWLLFFGSLAISTLLFIGGLLYFKKTEREFADVA